MVTSGALARLPEPELAAVLAHERAHAAGRHHRLCAVAGVLRHAYPRVPVFTQAHTQVARLVELCADEVAARAQSPLVLARALVTMAEAAATPGGLVAEPTNPGGLVAEATNQGGVMAEATNPGGLVAEAANPGGVLAAAGGDTAERITRLLQPLGGYGSGCPG